MHGLSFDRVSCEQIISAQEISKHFTMYLHVQQDYEIEGHSVVYS